MRAHHGLLHRRTHAQTWAGSRSRLPAPVGRPRVPPLSPRRPHAGLTPPETTSAQRRRTTTAQTVSGWYDASWNLKWRGKIAALTQDRPPAPPPSARFLHPPSRPPPIPHAPHDPHTFSPENPAPEELAPGNQTYAPPHSPLHPRPQSPLFSAHDPDIALQARRRLHQRGPPPLHGPGHGPAFFVVAAGPAPQRPPARRPHLVRHHRLHPLPAPRRGDAPRHRRLPRRRDHRHPARRGRGRHRPPRAGAPGPTPCRRGGPAHLRRVHRRVC